jgi:RNA polymerase sigma-70 factor (ECF subfamily)
MARALAEHKPGAAAAFYAQYAPHVRRTLNAVLGVDADVPDLLQDVFLYAVYNARQLRKPERLKAWLTSIAVFSARAQLARRTRRKRLNLHASVLPTQHDPACLDARNAVRDMYAILAELPVEEQTAFALRYLDGVSLADTAQACEISLSTLKRRLSRSSRRFLLRVQARPALAEWLKGQGWQVSKDSASPRPDVADEGTGEQRDVGGDSDDYTRLIQSSSITPSARLFSRYRCSNKELAKLG